MGMAPEYPRLPSEREESEKADLDGLERLQKTIARSGIASRRKAEVLILEGAVTVNGKVVTELGTKVNPARDKIKVEGQALFLDVDQVYLALYKPRGCIASLSDPEGRMHIGNFLRGIKERVVPVGRLSYNSEGLILLTNDGEMVERVVKKKDLVKTYMVKVKGRPSDRDLERLRGGIFTQEGVVRFAKVDFDLELRNKSWIKLDVVEGSNLDLRELLNHRGLMVDRIVRSGIGSIDLTGLEPGEYKVMTKKDFEALLKK